MQRDMKAGWLAIYDVGLVAGTTGNDLKTEQVIMVNASTYCTKYI